MPEVSIQIVKDLSPELKEQTDALRFRAFHKETFTPEIKTANEEKYLFEEGCFVFVIAFLENTPIGYVRLFKRKIMFHEKWISLGGIGGVCTDPEKQRKGIATKMLHAAMEELKKEKCDIAYLCTDITALEELYAQVGFVPLHHSYKFTGKSGKEYFGNNGMIAPLLSHEIFNEVLQDKNPFDLQGMNW